MTRLGYIGITLVMASFAVMVLKPEYPSLVVRLFVVGALLCAPKVIWEFIKYTFDLL